MEWWNGNAGWYLSEGRRLSSCTCHCEGSRSDPEAICLDSSLIAPARTHSHAHSSTFISDYQVAGKRLPPRKKVNYGGSIFEFIFRTTRV